MFVWREKNKKGEYLKWNAHTKRKMILTSQNFLVDNISAIPIGCEYVNGLVVRFRNYLLFIFLIGGKPPEPPFLPFRDPEQLPELFMAEHWIHRNNMVIRPSLSA